MNFQTNLFNFVGNVEYHRFELKSSCLIFALSSLSSFVSSLTELEELTTELKLRELKICLFDNSPIPVDLEGTLRDL